MTFVRASLATSRQLFGVAPETSPPNVKFAAQNQALVSWPLDHAARAPHCGALRSVVVIMAFWYLPPMPSCHTCVEVGDATFPTAGDRHRLCQSHKHCLLSSLSLPRNPTTSKPCASTCRSLTQQYPDFCFFSFSCKVNYIRKLRGSIL
jgi:hypothetical protein